MNFSEFPLWQEGQSVGMLLASPRGHGETGAKPCSRLEVDQETP